MICSASIAHLAGNTMPTPPIAPWGQYGSVLRLLPVGAIRLRATPIAPWGQYGSAPAIGGHGGSAPRCE